MYAFDFILSVLFDKCRIVVTFIGGGGNLMLNTITSREFNQDPTSAKRAALNGPVQITERGKVSHVLLSIERYEQLTGSQLSIVDLLAMPEVDDVEFSALDASSIKPAEFD